MTDVDSAIFWLIGTSGVRDYGIWYPRRHVRDGAEMDTVFSVVAALDVPLTDTVAPQGLVSWMLLAVMSRTS